MGANCTLTVDAWPGLSVTGKLTPETEKPPPLAITELIVTEAVPVDVNVTNFETLLFITTLPNETLVALRLSVGVVKGGSN